MDCKYIHISLAIILSIFSGADAGGRKIILRHGTVHSSYCESWKFSAENSDSGKWSTVPEQCEGYVQNYMTRGRYLSDSAFVANESITFAKSLTLAGDGKDAWVFDIDETLLSNLPYYAQHRYGSDAYNETLFDEWSVKAVAPALPGSLRLYKELQRLRFTIFLVTGKNEQFRNVTEKNLVSAGYRDWQQIFFRGKSDAGTKAVVYKSSKRKELEEEGYRIQGSSGDQWSDLQGNATAVRSFKLPNPMYYIA